MFGALLLAVAAVVLAGYMLARTGQALRASWFLVRIWRWLSGEPHHGHPITNAGWLRRGEGTAKTGTGHAHRWWYRPRWQRAAHRTGGTLGFILAVWGLLAALWLTVWMLGVTLLAAAVFGGWRGWLRIRRRRHDRSWLLPLHLAAHELAGWPRAVRASSWIATVLDDSGAVIEARLELPKGWVPDPQDEKQLVRIASEKLAIEAAEPTWRRGGPAPLLTLRHSPPPPGKFGMDRLLPELAGLAENQLLIGVGKNEELITASLHTDSPHIAISMGTGAGKSNLGSWLLFQMLIRGAIGSVLDPKRRLSYPWILKDSDRAVVQLPNVAYAWTTPQLHAAMAWLSTELDRRGDVAFAGMDTGGVVHANVGNRMFILAEELNLAVPRLKAYWQENRGPGDPSKSPAFTGLGEVAFAGRQVRKHLVLIGQMLTAEATGSRDSSVKENCGVKLLARYGPKGWRIMAEDIPMPPPPTELGRVQVVTAGQAREAQTPEFDPWEGRRLVLQGLVTPLPAGMPCGPARGVPADVPAPSQLPAPPPDLRVVSGEFPSLGPPEAVDLREAAASVVGCKLGALRKASQRQGFPAPVGIRGQAYVYDPDELARWDAGRR